MCDLEKYRRAYAAKFGKANETALAASFGSDHAGLMCAFASVVDIATPPKANRYGEPLRGSVQPASATLDSISAAAYKNFNSKRAAPALVPRVDVGTDD